jgi:hypothetical protein
MPNSLNRFLRHSVGISDPPAQDLIHAISYASLGEASALRYARKT